MSFERVSRIAEEFKRELSHIIKNDIRDPRIAEFTSILSVDITKDLRYAKVYISVLGDEKQSSDTISGLKSAAGFIRKEIGRRIKLKYTPEILFELDKSIERGIYITNLIKKTNQSGEDTR